MKTNKLFTYLFALVFGLLILNGCSKEETETPKTQTETKVQTDVKQPSSDTKEIKNTEIPVDPNLTVSLPLYKPDINSLFSSITTDKEKETLWLKISKEAEKNWLDISKRSEHQWLKTSDSAEKVWLKISEAALNHFKDLDAGAYYAYTTARDKAYNTPGGLDSLNMIEEQLKKSSPEFIKYRTTDHEAWKQYKATDHEAWKKYKAEDHEAWKNYKAVNHEAWKKYKGY